MAPTVAKDEEPSPLDAIEHDEDLDLYDYISQFGATGAIKVRVYRKSPTSYKGIKTDGAVATYEHPVSIDVIEQEHGGGKYQVMIEAMRKKNGKPRMGYVGGRTFDIAGAPKIASLIPHEEDDDPRKGNGDQTGPVAHALNMAQRLADARESELHELRTSMRGSGMDRDLMETILGPIQEQVRELNRAKSDLETRLFEMLNKPKQDDDEKWLRVFGDKEQTHSNNLEAVRQQYENRIAKLQDYHHEELRRYEDRFEREITSVRAAADREIQSLKLAHAQALESQKHGYEMRLEGLKDIMKRLEREVAKAETEVAGLRSKKEQGPLEQIQGLVGLKQGFEALMPSGGEERSGWERVLDVVANSPIAETIVGRIASGAAQMGQEEEQAAPQLVPIQLPDGRVVQVPPAVVERMRQQQAAKERQREELGVEIPDISEADMAKAVTFMEAAIRNQTDPAMFAASARNMLPDDILTALKRVGVDAFLAKVAKIQTGSPLATVQGRAWVRQVAAYLLGAQEDDQPDDDIPDEEVSDDDIPDDDEPAEEDDDSNPDSPVEGP